LSMCLATYLSYKINNDLNSMWIVEGPISTVIGGSRKS
jgi:hypothetical protein